MKFKTLLITLCSLSGLAAAQNVPNTLFSGDSNKEINPQRLYKPKSGNLPQLETPRSKESKAEDFSTQKQIRILKFNDRNTLANGGQDGSGGDLLKTKEEFILNYLDSVLYNGFYDLYTKIQKSLNEKAVLPIRDIKARSMLENIFRLPHVNKFNPYAKNQPKSIEIVVNKDSECIDNVTGEKKVASLLKSAVNSPIRICMSLKKLMEFPEDVFHTHHDIGNDGGYSSFQIPILIFHELAHAANYGEADASSLQEYLFNRFLYSCTMTITDLDIIPEGFLDGHIHVNIDDSGEATIKRWFYKYNGEGEERFDKKVSSMIFNESKLLNRFELSSYGGAMTLEMGNRDGSRGRLSLSWKRPEPGLVGSRSYDLKAYGTLDGKTISTEGNISLTRGCLLR